MSPVGSQQDPQPSQVPAIQKLSRVFEMPDLTVPGEVLSRAEIEFFRDNGFLIKQQLLDQAKIDRAMDRIWPHLIDNVPTRDDSNWVLDRHDRASWVNPQWAPMPPHPESGPFQGRQPREYYGRIVKLHDIGREDYLLDLLPNDPGVRAIARRLLGDDLRPSRVTRGVYAVFPTRNETDPGGEKRLRGASLGPHTDQVCQQLNSCAYLADVAPRSGGFTVYPGSHKHMFEAHANEANWSPLPVFASRMREVVETIEPLELIAGKGSVIFWHGRLVHSVGIHVGQDIRWALFDDFTQDRAVLDEAAHRRVGQYEWFKNAKLFESDYPVTADMWRHWRIGAT